MSNDKIIIAQRNLLNAKRIIHDILHSQNVTLDIQTIFNRFEEIGEAFTMLHLEDDKEKAELKKQIDSMRNDIERLKIQVASKK